MALQNQSYSKADPHALVPSPPTHTWTRLNAQGAVQLESIREDAAVPPAWASSSGTNSRPASSHTAQHPHSHKHCSEDVLAQRRQWLPALRWPGLPVDLLQLLRTASEYGMLPAVLPCVAEMLAFVHFDPLALHTGARLAPVHLVCSGPVKEHLPRLLILYLT